MCSSLRRDCWYLTLHHITLHSSSRFSSLISSALLPILFITTQPIYHQVIMPVKIDPSLRSLFSELSSLLDRHSSEHPISDTFDSALELIQSQLSQLEKPIALLQQLQREAEKKKKNKTNLTTTPSSSSSSAASTSSSSTSPSSLSSPTSSSSSLPSAPATTTDPIPTLAQLSAFSSWLSEHAPNSNYGATWSFDVTHRETEGIGLLAEEEMKKGE